MKCYNCDNELSGIMIRNDEMRFKCFGSNKNIYKCPTCNLIQMKPQWTIDELNTLYKGYVKKQYTTSKQKPIKSIRKYLRKYVTKESRTLEIGSGNGDNLNYLRKYTKESIGIDKDILSDSVKENTKLAIDFDTFHDLYPNEKYDFIYAIHVLEHINDPRDFIKKIISHLNDNGKVVLELPSTDEPLYTIYKSKAFISQYWFPYHVFFYTPETLNKVLEIYNIKIKLYQRYGIIGPIRFLIFGTPGEWFPHFPIIDNIYKFIFEHIIRKTDTMIVEVWR